MFVITNCRWPGDQTCQQHHAGKATGVYVMDILRAWVSQQDRNREKVGLSWLKKKKNSSSYYTSYVFISSLIIQAATRSSQRKTSRSRVEIPEMSSRGRTTQTILLPTRLWAFYAAVLRPPCVTYTRLFRPQHVPDQSLHPRCRLIGCPSST